MHTHPAYHHKREHRIVNWPMLLRVAGWLMMMEAAFMLIPLAVCLAYGESDRLPFAATAAGTALAGFLLSRRIKPTHHSMAKREGFLLTAMVWVIFSIFGMLPFIFGTPGLGLSDAFFEAMSGFTTTGASVLPSGSAISHGVHIWRATMQWLGGMGIILFTIAVIPMLNSSGGMLMFNAEVTGITHDKLRPRISQTAKTLWLIYISLTLVLVALLWAGPMDLFDSLCHAFGAISTGGYSTQSTGVGSYASVYVKVVLTVFMFAGGVNFSLIYRGLRGDIEELQRNDVFRSYVWLILAMFALFSTNILIRGCYTGWESVTIDPLFQVVSVITSTGFTPAAFDSWGPMVLALVFFMMFFGGCAGSTSGGAKIDRLLFLIKNCRNEVYRCIYPRAVMSVRINGRVVSSELVHKVIAFLCLYMMLIAAGGVVLSAMGVPVVDAFFSSFSCMSNTGLGADITGYGSSYEMLPDAAKWVLSMLMLTGRLEIFTVLVLLYPSFWRK
ncbi:MAG: TrkH family potassium uptake protein [Muribaculaceae bacterium]|nr:TrkH family potassium uptake protein [Muribaculaceae bacterium]